MATNLSILEILNLGARLVLYAPPQLAFNLGRLLVVGWHRSVHLRPYTVCAFIRVFLGAFTPRQIQFLGRTAQETYKSWILEKTHVLQGHPGTAFLIDRLTPRVDLLSDGKSSLLWVGCPRKAQKVVLFFHGGGYMSPLTAGHLEWCWYAHVQAGVEVGVETAVAVLEYTLCPAGTYPCQFIQAVAALSHLLSLGIRPGNIILGADSAGGMLATQLLCHLVHPQPVAATVDLAEPLGGAFLVSPWISANTRSPMFKNYGDLDMVSSAIADKMSKGFLALNLGTENTPCNTAFPLDRNRSYLDHMASSVEDIYITAGEYEVLGDQIGELVSELRSRNPDLPVRFDILPKLGHDFILVEGMIRQPGLAMKSMKAWMVNRLRQKLL